MLLDGLGLLRGDGSSPLVTATEAGATSLTRDATTGKAAIAIHSTGKDGIPIVVIAAADTGTSTDKEATVTIEGADNLDFSTGGKDTLATFPTQAHDGQTAITMIRRIHTKRKYIRSVITVTGSNGTFSRDYLIFITSGLMDRNS